MVLEMTGLTSRQMWSIDNNARRYYRYRRDPEGQDNWRSYHKQVLAKEFWEDDCDSLASTVANLLALDGHPLNKLWFAHVDSNTQDAIAIDHMIGFAESSDGDINVVGDTFGPCYPAIGMRHRLVRFCRLDDVTKWYAGSDVRQLKMMP